MPAVRALCLDPGHTVGWAAYGASGERYGEVPLEGDQWGTELDHFARWLTWTLDESELQPELIAIEEPPPLPPSYPAVDRHLLEGVFALTTLIARRRGIRCVGRSPLVIKKHATGNGRAKKRDVLAAVNRARRGRAITSDHVADAVALLDLIRETERIGDDAFLLRAG